MKYGKRPLWKKIASSPLTIIALVVVLFFAAKAAFNVNRQAQASATRLAQAKAALESLKTRQSDLSRRVNNLSTDEGLEAEIRTKYHAAREGELVAVIIDDEATTSEQSSAVGEGGWWKEMLRAVGL